MKKGENHQRIFHIQKSLGSKCQLQQFWFLGTHFSKKDISSRKLRKWTSPMNSSYSNYFENKISS